MTKIVADNKIPFLNGVLEPFANILYYNPKEITMDRIKDTDALIIRTRTICNRELLEGTKVKFIATATIGFDHIDVEYCKEKKITWINAPGCNSYSVMQYMASALVTIANKKGLVLNNTTIGIIGVGNVGSKVVQLSKALDMKVLQYDPPRMRKEGKSDFVHLEELISESDIITFHVPLTKDGQDKTYHMFDEVFVSKLASEKILINTSRGSVVKTSVLKNAIRDKVISGCVLDVWENEPLIDKELLGLVDLATPHIAGYSADGKANGTAICIRGINSFFKLSLGENWFPDKIPSLNILNELKFDCVGKTNQQVITEIILATYDVKKDDSFLRESPDTFEKQRGNYPVRREFPFYKIYLQNCNKELFTALLSLGYQVFI
jgi:erythronate-4-phosphate dehydrogenase